MGVFALPIRFRVSLSSNCPWVHLFKSCVKLHSSNKVCASYALLAAVVVSKRKKRAIEIFLSYFNLGLLYGKAYLGRSCFTTDETDFQNHAFLAVEEYLSDVSRAVSGDPNNVELPTGVHLRDNEDALFLLTQCGNDSEEVGIILFDHRVFLISSSFSIKWILFQKRKRLRFLTAMAYFVCWFLY